MTRYQTLDYHSLYFYLVKHQMVVLGGQPLLKNQS